MACWRAEWVWGAEGGATGRGPRMCRSDSDQTSTVWRDLDYLHTAGAEDGPAKRCSPATFAPIGLLSVQGGVRDLRQEHVQQRQHGREVHVNDIHPSIHPYLLTVRGRDGSAGGRERGKATTIPRESSASRLESDRLSTAYRCRYAGMGTDRRSCPAKWPWRG